MEKGQVILISSVQCKPEDDERFNRWMDEVHIPMLLKFKGLKSATRYKLLYPSDKYSRYMAQYVFDSKEAFEAYEASPELAAARGEMAKSWGKGELEPNWRVQYQVISRR